MELARLAVAVCRRAWPPQNTDLNRGGTGVSPVLAGALARCQCHPPLARRSVAYFMAVVPTAAKDLKMNNVCNSVGRISQSVPENWTD